jgi:hypothetical protein
MLCAAAAAAATTYVLFSQAQEETFEDEVRCACTNHRLFRLFVSQSLIVFVLLFLLLLLPPAACCQQFYQNAEEIQTFTGIKTETIFASIENLALTITSYAVATNKTWPYVVVPDFSARAHQLIYVSGATNVEISMIVSKSTSSTNHKLLWEQFANDNHEEWIRSGLEWEHRDDTVTPITPVIFKQTNADDGEDGDVEPDFVPDMGNDDLPYYMPTWQSSPVNIGYVNYNPMHRDVFRSSVAQIELTRHGTLSEGLGESLLLQPVFDRVDHEIHDQVVEEGMNETSMKNVVGVVGAGIPWTYYFRDILSDDTPPIRIVLQDTCGRFKWTYQINGYNVTLVAYGDDVHDAKYDQFRVDGILHQSDHLETFIIEQEDHGDHVHRHRRAATVDGLNTGGICVFTYSIYPTQEFEDTYKNQFPIYATLAVLAIFVITTCIFIMYDIVVGRRYSRIEATATRTNAIVSSLFPAQVRDRLMENADEPGTANKRNSNLTELAGSQHGTKMLPGPYLGDGKAAGGAVTNSASAPIADLFPSATVMFGTCNGLLCHYWMMALRFLSVPSTHPPLVVFLHRTLSLIPAADIASFTAWSSVREPSQVFMLLEEIYNSFDAIAKKRRVFKVETIGDSYGKSKSITRLDPSCILMFTLHFLPDTSAYII